MRRLVEERGSSTLGLGLSSLGIRIGFAVLFGICSFAAFVVWYSTSKLAEAEANTGASTVLAIARTFSGNVTSEDLHDGPSLRLRLEELQKLNPEIRKAAIYAFVAGRPTRLASTNTNAGLAEPHDLVPLRTGESHYSSEREDGFHLGELNFPLVHAGRRFAVLGLYYDLGALDRLHKERRQQLMVAAGSTALLLTVLLSLALRQGIFRPLNVLRLTTHRIAEGELGTRLAWQRKDELGALARDFDYMAIELERGHRQLQTLALEDSVTGLLNHRSLKERLAAELGRAQREGYTVSLVTLDIDRFKDVNDRLGHAVGDAALRGLAAAMRDSVRPSDICGRIGGDEFMIVLPRANGPQAERIVGRIRHAIEAVGMGKTGQPITISAGIAEFPRDASDEAELSRLADGALYQAKRGGRDRAFRYSAHGTDPLSHDETDFRLATGSASGGRDART